MTPETRKAIETAWTQRAEEQGLKPNSRIYRRAEVNFFAGAMTAINAIFPNEDPKMLSPEVPVAWLINALGGRPIVSP